MHKFSVTPKIYYSDGAYKSLKQLCPNRIFVIIDPYMESNGFGNKIAGLFEGEKVELRFFSQIKPDPDARLVTAGVWEALSFKPDVFVAVGGGSAIDEAKAVFFMYKKIVGKDSARFAVIPTTSGTGSEVTNYAVITLEGIKYVLQDDGFLPDIAVIDIEFAKSMPLSLLADTAVDALTHGIEAYLSINESDCSDALCEKAIKLIFKYLKNIFAEGDSIYGRTKLHNASCIAGMAFTNAQLGINHSMAHSLGAVFHIPHGRANAVFLDSVIKYNSGVNYIRDKLANLCYELRLNRGDNCIDSFRSSLKELLTLCGMPVCVKDLGIDRARYEQSIAELTERALLDICTATNPITPTRDDFIRLFRESYEQI